eukprot:8754427-Alexandrium_andersonii.AAC.1
MLRRNASEDGGAQRWGVNRSLCRPIDPGRQPALQRTMRVYPGSIRALLIRASQARSPQDFLR